MCDRVANRRLPSFRYRADRPADGRRTGSERDEDRIDASASAEFFALALDLREGVEEHPDLRVVT